MTAMSERAGKRPRKVPTPQDTEDLIAAVRDAAANLEATTTRLVYLVDAVLPEILPGLTEESANGTRRRPDTGSDAAAAADRTG